MPERAESFAQIPKYQRTRVRANRNDIELLFEGLPEPIDLELDLNNRVLYWTDRGDPPRGNTVNRASIDGKQKKSQAQEILLTHLMEGIRIALDLKGQRMFLTDLGGPSIQPRSTDQIRRHYSIHKGTLLALHMLNCAQVLREYDNK